MRVESSLLLRDNIGLDRPAADFSAAAVSISDEEMPE
jgi:hypothetical protein